MARPSLARGSRGRLPPGPPRPRRCGTSPSRICIRGRSSTSSTASGENYLPAALERVEGLLRDYRTGERHPIDPQLLDILYDVAQRARVEPEFSVISGYRSPQTNAMLHERSSGVASHSLHMEGRAIDVRLTRMDCADLAATALDMQCGGVGYYRQSDFVHLDTGRFRTWRG